MEQQHLYRARPSKRARPDKREGGQVIDTSQNSKPLFPRSHKATSSPYRTPLAAAKFYGRAQGDGEQQRTPPQMSRADTSPCDGSLDEIDFLSAPSGLHHRMRGRQGTPTRPQGRTSASGPSLTLPVLAFFVNQEYGYQGSGTELVSFSEHLSLLHGVDPCAKIAWRDVSRCQCASDGPALLLLHVAGMSASGKSLAALCGATKWKKVLLAVLLGTGTPDLAGAWTALKSRMREIMPLEMLSGAGSKSILESLQAAAWAPVSLPFATAPAPSLATSDVPKTPRCEEAAPPVQATTPPKQCKSQTPSRQTSGSKDTITIDLDTPPSSPTPTGATHAHRQTRSQSRAHHAALVDADNEAILRYPAAGPYAVTLLRSDLRRLDDEEFLNDTLIEFGLRYLYEQVAADRPALAEQMYIFNSFFFSRLTEYRDRAKSYAQVRKWTHRFNMCVLFLTPVLRKSSS